MRSFYRTLSVILLVLWMGFIFYMSAQPAEISSEISGGFIEIIAEKLYPDYQNLTQAEQSDIVASFQFLVRKGAHIGGFALLGVLSLLSFISYTGLRFFTRVFWSLFVSVAFAASDEIHQSFVAGRSCELRDFLLDTAGVVGAIIITVLFIKIIPVLRRKTAFVTVGSTKLLHSFSDQTFDLDQVATAKETEELKGKIEQQQKIIEDLTASLSEKTEEINQIKALSEGTEMKAENLPEDMEYAASIIGKVTVEVTKVCNKLLIDADNENAKELVNLALGRNEVFKANVLKILGKQVDFSEKKVLIEKERNEAFDYFNSILAQNC